MRNRSTAWFVPATAALFLMLVAGLARAAADPAVQAVADLVSQTDYQAYHLDIENMGLGEYGGATYNMGYRNRNGWEGPGSRGNQEARLYLRDTFAAMGLGVSVQGSYLNVVGELTGTTTPENIFIIGGHYDHIGDDRPGGDDNASGTAGVLEAARVLSQYRFESTIRFIGFNAEEDGLLGSTDYVDNHVIPSGENILGMINMDMILRPGSDANPNAVIDADLETRTNYPATVPWCHAYQQAAADYVPSLTVDPTIAHYDEGYSDHDPFVLAGFPAFMVIENSGTDWEGANPYYHGYQDASDRLANDPNSPSGVTYDFAFATDVARTAVALIAQEATLLPEPSADFDGDGDVDGDDFLDWQASFGVDDGGDSDFDGDTDGDDFLTWQTEFGSGSGSASVAVPEPTSIVLLFVMATIGVFSRRVGTNRPMH